ncbi:uncharacterized protein T551_03703 [Pneumocystis jirovecii RU7]|uniref:Major surface glycoprotein 2 C-terminal domain-containing protein n=2 Tax=Pneumocystis jirovecii TaxID=42068 RepID=A0A0W4ZAW6_PNEJ7|nr:uncharacterized protein T551_03703 [Pneumocystis jirovecii RU7]KTW25527.1 hypothetical protein T551_03703 [Pneumocystis jirovecii RU7]
MARAVARAVKRQAQQVVKSVYDDEDYLLALILKEDAMVESQCKEKLEKYCKALTNATIEPKDVHNKFKDFCEDKKQKTKCTGLKSKITQKCTEFKNKLEGKLANLPDKDCKEDERQCLFLEGACPTELKDDCNTLRNKCYQKKRDGVAEEVLLRALRGDLEEEAGCKKKIKNVCSKIGQESDELTLLCLDQKKTCANLVEKGKSKCDTLKQEVEETLKKNKLRGKCLPLLEQCYFHRGNCKDISKCNKSSKNCYEYLPVCDKLAEECEKKSIIYMHPGPDFDPTRPEPTLAEDIGLEELYKRTEEDGVFIGKQHVRDATALLASLVKNDLKKEKCEEVLANKCKNSHEHEALEDLCNNNTPNTNGTEKCKELKEDVEETCKILTLKVNNRLFDIRNSETIEWGKLPTFISKEDCAKLETYCFYYEGSCPSGKDACKNIRATCYRKGLNARANDILQENMRGLLRGSNETWLKKFQQELVKVCKELKEKNKGSFPNDELFVLCIQPAKAARLLTYDHQMKTVFLRKQLDKKRDFPTDKDCKKLGRKCETLGKDSNQIQWPCYTLKQQCDRLGTTEILKQVLLNEHKDTLKDQESCVKYLKEKCNKWSRRGNDRFSLVCVFLESTCKLMVEDVQDRCKVFKENTDGIYIIKFLETNNTLESLAGVCPPWHPYCDRYGPNCPDLLGKDTLCKSLKKYCKPFYKRKVLEDALKVELRGNLSNITKCEPALGRYCAVLKDVNNASISSLCKDNTESKTKKTDEVRKKLCLKLVEEVEEQCKVLPKELEYEEKDLKDDFGAFEKLKEQAEKAINKSNLVLSLVKKDGNDTSKSNSKNKDKNAISNKQDTTKHVKILRRGVKDVLVTELEAKAFDLVAEVFGRYVDLKERCEKLTSDCGIKEDCKELKDVCEKIQGVCSKLKPLKVKPHEIVTESTTTTTTTTTTVTDPKATECKSLQTTDTWVTQTSTHTSTSTITSTITSKITLTSTRRCKPTKCTTGDDAEDVKPNEGLKMSGWSVMRGVILAMMISIMI